MGGTDGVSIELVSPHLNPLPPGERRYSNVIPISQISSAIF